MGTDLVLSGLTFQGETEIDPYTSKFAAKAVGGGPRTPVDGRRGGRTHGQERPPEEMGSELSLQAETWRSWRQGPGQGGQTPHP